MKCHYYTCDVFTDTRFGGNPLAVIPDARALTDQQMQQIAREFNYSESTFVLPADNGHTRRVRIFSPTTELPFAGHPNVGTAFVLATTGELGAISQHLDIVFEEIAGLVPVGIQRDDSQTLHCELKAPESLSLGPTQSQELLAQILSLPIDAIVTDTHEPQLASVGLPFTITELRDHNALKQATINLAALREIQSQGLRPSIYVYTKSNDEFDIRCRMFAPLGGTVEDPATGSANCALAALLTHHSNDADGTYNWRIAQGVEMGRPSVLNARTVKAAGKAQGVWVAGQSVMVSEGHITLA